MDVLEEEDGRAVLGHALEEHPRRGEQVLLVARGGLLDAEQVAEARLDETPLLRVGEVLLDSRRELLPGGRRLLVLDDAGAPANHLGEGPERHPVAVREAAPASAT